MLLADLSSRVPSFAAALAAPLAAPPARPYLVYRTPAGKDVTLAWSEVATRVARLRATIFAWGLPAGARVLVASDDDAALAVTLVAAWLEGLSCAIVNPGAPGPEAAQLIEAAGPRAAMVDDRLASSWALPAGAPVVLASAVSAPASAGKSVLGRLLGKSAAPAAPLRDGPALATGPDQATEAYILFTSGSTAQPHGVRQSRGALLAHARTLARVFGYDQRSRLLSPLPSHHADGFVALMVPFLCGATALRPQRQVVGGAAELLDAVWRDRATHVVVVPAILSMMLAQSEGRTDAFRGGDLRALVSCAGFLGEALWAAVEERFGVRVSNFYGLTETVTGGVFCGPDDASYRRGTVGKAVDCEVKLVDGELWLRGNNVMLGYLDDASTAELLTADGWLKTGDLASIDEQTGLVTITGRKKHLVISGGENIQPEEVVFALERLPGVAAAAAFGVPDELLGERLVALVVPRDPAAPVPTAELVAGLREQITAYKIPRDLRWVDDLPRGPAGKVITSAARERYLALAGVAQGSGPAPALDEAALATRADVARGVRAAAAAAFRVPEELLGPDASPTKTPGWDSFAHLSFVIELEHRFAIRLGPADIGRLRSLGDAERVVHDRVRA